MMRSTVGRTLRLHMGPASWSAPAGVYGCTGIGTSTHSQPRVLATSHGKRKDTLCRSTAAARRWADTFKCTGSPAACHGAESNVARRDAGRPRSTAVLNRRYASGGALLPSSPGGPLYDCDGFMAATYNSRDPGTSATGDM